MKLLTLPISLIALLMLFSTPVLGQNTFCEQVPGSGETEFCQNQETGDDNQITGDGGILTQIIEFMVIIIGFLSVFIIIIAGFMYMTSGGDPGKTARARSYIIYAMVGVIIAVLAQSIVVFVLDRL